MEGREENTICDGCYMPQIWPENEPAVLAWMAIGTQWVHAGMDGVRVGLNYAGVESGLRLGGHDLALWPEIRSLERETLNIDAGKRNKPKPKGPT
jgi:hypothetical protein